MRAFPRKRRGLYDNHATCYKPNTRSVATNVTPCSGSTSHYGHQRNAGCAESKRTVERAGSAGWRRSWGRIIRSGRVAHQAGSAMRLTWCFERNGEVLRLRPARLSKQASLTGRRGVMKPLSSAERYTPGIKIRGQYHLARARPPPGGTAVEPVIHGRHGLSAMIYFFSRQCGFMQSCTRFTARAHGDRTGATNANYVLG